MSEPEAEYYGADGRPTEKLRLVFDKNSNTYTLLEWTTIIICVAVIIISLLLIFFSLRVARSSNNVKKLKTKINEDSMKEVSEAKTDGTNGTNEVSEAKTN